MEKICCFLRSERYSCNGQARFPHSPHKTTRWNLDAEKHDETYKKVHCNVVEQKRKMELKRRKMIKKLKFEYRMNVDDLSSNIVEEMISHVQVMEKQRTMLERNVLERKLKFINKILDEEKYKRRGLKLVPLMNPKMRKNRQSTVAETSTKELGCERSQETTPYTSISGEKSDFDPKLQEEAEVVHLIAEERSESDQTKCDEESTLQPLSAIMKAIHNQQHRDKISTENEETDLKCNPSSVIFENYKPNKTQVQIYRISNIGSEVIHCRYAGIEMKDLPECHPVPFRAEAVDNVLLRPGLSFSAKVRMFPWNDISELHCSLVFETRRRKTPNRPAYFRVPVRSLPSRSIVNVSPTVLRFPTVSWCDATGSKPLTSTIQIKNKGSKACSCSISKVLFQEDNEEQGTKSKLYLTATNGSHADSIGTVYQNSSEEEYPGEIDYCQGDNEVDAILSELVNNVFEIFRFSPKYYIHIPAMSSIKVNVEFIPEYRGYHHEVVYVRFEGADNCTEEKIDVIGDIKKIPLRVEPSTIDLKICTINSGVYEGVFKVFNTSNGSYPIRLKVPGSMKEHSLVYPKATVLQPWSFQVCSVRLFPRLTISNDAIRYYKEDTKVLEFPVFIQPAKSNSCKKDQIKLYVFAILTNYALELKPVEIDFQRVSTIETVRAEISLTNHSMAMQEFGFLNLPMGVRVEPNQGFGTILPKETITLYILFSPVLNHSVKRKLDREGNYIFYVRVTSIAQLSCFQKPTEIKDSVSAETVLDEELLYTTETERVSEEYLDPRQSEKYEEEEEEEEEDQSLMDEAEELKLLEDKQMRIRQYLREKKLTASSDCFDNINSIVEEEESNMDDCEQSQSYTYTLRNSMQIITCRAVIVNPLCELSSSVIQLPATPLSSFSVTRFRLNGINHNNDGVCNCSSKVKGKNREESSFQAVFEFQSSSALITIEPRTGNIKQGDSLPVAIIFKPVFNEKELQFQSRILKAEAQFEDSQSKESLSVAQKTNSKYKVTKRGNQGSIVKQVEAENIDVDLKSFAITKADEFAGERELQKMFDPFHLIVKVTCALKIMTCQSRQESMEYHTLILIAPVIKPSFSFLGPCQEVNFGKVAVGSRARKILEIQNISLKRISPRISALNPLGPFFCTTGWKMDKVDPEHIWRQPITFIPQSDRGKEKEFFEIYHGATTISLTVTGEGISPKYEISPNFSLSILEVANDASNEIEIYIENKCEAELTMKFVTSFIREATSFRDEMAITEVYETRKSDIGAKKHDKKANQTVKDTKKRISFFDELNSEVVRQLEEDFVDIDIESDIFSIIGLDENKELIISPFSKMPLKIKFWTGKEYNSPSPGESESPSTVYAVRYKIMLAGTIPIKEMTIMGIIHRQ